MITFTLPSPPSTNNLFLNARGRGRIKTTEYRQWIAAAGLILNASRAGKRLTLDEPAAVIIRIGKCNQARDADNFCKAVNDLLVAAGVLRGDNLIHVHSVSAEKAFGDVPDGMVSVTVSPVKIGRAAA